MPLHLIIDGYNFIRQSDDLKGLDRQALEFGREALIEKLAAYRRVKRHKVTLVFDGSAEYFFPDAETARKGVGIKFSRHGESADALIKKMVQREREKAVVVSSDRDVGRFAQTQGGTVIGSGEFEEKLMMAVTMESGESPEADTHRPKRAQSTKKKGPSRKPPKSRRRVHRKTRKL